MTLTGICFAFAMAWVPVAVIAAIGWYKRRKEAQKEHVDCEAAALPNLEADARADAILQAAWPDYQARMDRLREQHHDTILNLSDESLREIDSATRQFMRSAGAEDERELDEP